MICLVMLSLGASFASDDVADVVAIDDLANEESIAIEEDASLAVAGEDSSSVVTNDTVYNYFDESGTLLSNVTSDELIFEGTFENLNVSALNINRAIKLTGENATFNDISLGIAADNVSVSGFIINQFNGSSAIVVMASDVTVSNSEINYVDNGNGDAFGIYALDSKNFKLLDNVVNYIGNSPGYYVNNAVLISNSSNSEIKRNKINASLISAPVGWEEVPPGSGNWQPTLVISEGVVIKESDDVIFEENEVTLTHNNVSGAYDTIYTISVKKSSNAVVFNNTINALGHTYIYGIQVNGDNFTIAENEIVVESDNYYANGIDIEGPATGIVEDNVIDVTGVESAYAVYSGMNGADVSANYTGNNVSASAYNVFGFSLGDVVSGLNDNYIALNGNYTTGVAYRGSFINATENQIVLISSEEGNLSVWEGFGVEAVGIKVIKGSAVLTNNTIATPGKGVSLTGNETSAYLEDNYINVVGNADKDAYAVYAKDMGQLYVIDNHVDYQGATNGAAINNALYVDNATAPMIALNVFDLDLVSSFVPWAEVPAGSGIWVSSPISEGIVITNSNDAVLSGNEINVAYGDVVGAYDTLYAVDVCCSDNAVIAGNDINAKGHTYIYGIIISGNNFTVAENNITTDSDNYYANGIDIEGPATGIVEDNIIDVTGVESAYAVYSGMNGADVSANYTGNNVSASAYNVFGFSLGDVVSGLNDNYIALNGNYTTGVAYRGSFINATENQIVLISSEEGNLSVWEGFGVEAVGIKVIKGSAVLTNNTIATPGKGVSLTGNETSAYLEDNYINVVGNADKDAYAVYAKDMGQLYVIDNHVDYQGATNGAAINNALYVDNATAPMIALNVFDLDLVSSFVPWAEVPAGSGIWVSSPISEGIVITNSNDAVLSGNEINVAYGDVVGSYDTLYAVDVCCSDNAVIEGNDINALGHTYIYGIIISGNNFTIAKNNINTASDNYYANGIDIEGPATGIVEDNSIDVIGVESAYAIYSGMNGANVSAAYSDNDVRADAYNVFGMSLGDVESVIVDNHIILLGNYTTAIAFRGSNLTVDNNMIIAAGSNEGNLSVWESFGVETIGIKVAKGEATIINNNIITTGDYAIDLEDNVASVHENYLIGDKYVGDDSVNNSAKADVYNNNPSKASSIITVTEVTGDINIIGVLKDSNGNVLPNKEIIYTFNGTNATVKTDENGTFEIANLTNGEVTIAFDGGLSYKPTNVTITLKDIAPVIVKVESAFNITDRAITINGYAVDTDAGEEGIYYATELLDANGNPISDVYIEFAVNNKIYNRTTDENGSFTPYKLNMKTAGRYTMAFNFAGNDNYTNAFACVCVDLDKKPIKIKASNKSYKASAKTKKYTVTLSTIVGSSHDGKAHLKSGMKVSLKVNGKTYTGKTNKDGKVTFKITNLSKKAKYTAKISYDGDRTYESQSKTVKLTIK